MAMAMAMAMAKAEARGQAEIGFDSKPGLVARARVTPEPVSRYNAAIVLAGFAC